MVPHTSDAYKSFVESPPERSSRVRSGVRGGLVSAAATAGAVIGFGVRNGDWAGPFRDLAYDVLTGLGAEPPFLFPLATGLIAHAALFVFWGIVHAIFAARRTTGTAIVLAVVLSVIGAWLAADAVPAAFGAVRFAKLPGVQVVLCVVLCALGMMSSRMMDNTA